MQQALLIVQTIVCGNFVMSVLHVQRRERVLGPVCLKNTVSNDEWEAFASNFPVPQMKDFLDYWKSNCPEGDIPDRKDITPIGMKKYLANISIIDIDLKTFDGKYRLVGSNVEELLGLRIKGKCLSEVVDKSQQEYFRTGFKHIATEGRVLLNIFNLGFLNKEHKTAYTLALPVKHEGEISKVLYYSYGETTV